MENHKAWDELLGTLYSPEGRAKIERLIGGALCADHNYIWDKLLVLCGPFMTGKTTTSRIIDNVFRKNGIRNYFEIRETNDPNEVSRICRGSLKECVIVYVTQNVLPKSQFQALISRIDNEFEGIISKCVKVYRNS
jgi:hypothetical protein